MPYEPWQWIAGTVAAILIGISKTGLPGFGILVVPLLAYTYGPTASVGIMLPMLIFADIFAVTWYRRHAQWWTLVSLLPWVVFGMAVGAVSLWAMGQTRGNRDILGVVIGVLVLVMLILHLLRGKLGEQFTPTSTIGIAATGIGAGFATTVSNAAGPVMTVYMAAQRVTKEQFVGTLAWYFFVLNLVKVPIFAIITHLNPSRPIFTATSLKLDMMLCPMILVGVFAGKWVLKRIPQNAFDSLVVALAAVAAVKLIVG